MKNKSLPAVLAIVVLLILTCLTVVFVADYYSAFGDQFSNTFYKTTGRLPLYGTKALDAESVQFGIERAAVLEEFNDKSSEDLNYGLFSDSLPLASDDSGVHSASPASDDQSGRDPEIIYVVYCENLIKSGGI